MNFDIKYLKARGVSSEAWSKIFTADRSKYPERVKKLIDLHRQRIYDSRTINLKEWRAYHAVDLAYGVPFQQQTATLVQNILSRKLNKDDTMEALKAYGLSETELFMQVEGADGKPVWVPNPPVLHVMFIPIVKAYVTTVLAQIYNERNQNPLLKYSPLKQTDRDRLLTEIITDTINTVATNYGYAAVYRQAIQQMLKYGIMLAFPREEWHHEEQGFEIDGVPQVVTVKEGLRYTHPHPTRMFYDLKYPLTSLNTDTGTDWMGHWHVMSYGQLLDEPKYWNRANLYCGTNWFQCPQAGNYFSEVFPCRMAFPSVGWEQTVTREDRAAYYNSSTRDQSVFVSEKFHKLIPGDWDLGDYKYPIWARFTYAGDDTVIWAEPCAYTPGWFMGYDYDEQAAQNSSLGLELIPWQDQLGNILSQLLLTAKQNLTNFVFFDTNIVDEQDIKRIRNLGESKYRSMEFIPADFQKFRHGQNNIRDAFIPVTIPQKSIAEQLQTIPLTLSIMERVLNISAQEAGSAASHQQGKTEIALTASAGRNRRQLTSSSVDEGEDAWKRQLYNAFQAHGDAKISAQVSTDIEGLEGHLSEIGFTIKSKGDKITIEGQKEKLALVTFASSNDGPVRDNQKEIAPLLFQLVGTIAGQEDLHKLVGAKNLLKILEWGAVLGGVPQELARLPITKDDKGEAQLTPELQQAMVQLSQEILKTVETKIAQPAAQQAGKTEGEVQQIQQHLKQLDGIFQIAKAANDKTRLAEQEAQSKLQIEQAEAKQKMAIREAEFQAEEKRKQEKHQLDLQQQVQKANTQTAILAHKTANTPVESPS